MKETPKERKTDSKNKETAKLKKNQREKMQKEKK
jgi:hypothetical protein